MAPSEMNTVGLMVAKVPGSFTKPALIKKRYPVFKTYVK